MSLKLGNVTLDFAAGKTVLDLVEYLKENRELAKQAGFSAVVNTALLARINGELKDLSSPIPSGAQIEILDGSSPEGLDVIRHSTAHLLAQAVLRLYPGTLLGIGPVIKDGFYYDMDLSEPLSEEALAAIEKEMEKISQEKLAVSREEISRKEALERYKKAQDNYKIELLEDMENDTVSIYHQGEFSDLCRGPHVPNTSMLKAFKLMSLAGAYWRGSEKNKMLTRIYGTAFADKKELKDYIYQLEEAKKRDHRKLGKELGLFSFHEEGPGLPFYLPKGVILKNQLIQFMREKIEPLGYVEIETPTMLKDHLWETSGHMANYKENMFFTNTEEEEAYAIKPMNCPGGILVYKEEKHSYRELPLKVAEFGKVHRFERSGQLNGLIRVRGFTQDDAHVFLTMEQVEDQILELIQLIDDIYSTFGFEYKLELSTKPENAIGNKEFWETSTQSLKNALDRFGKSYVINEGDGAFYGPKIDYHLRDAIGRTHQCGTIQLDPNLPERFGLTYTGADGQDHRVIMLHRAIFGSVDRFMAILIEHFAGKFPVWLSPVQTVLLPVSDKFNDYALDVKAQLKKQGLRVDVDMTSEKLGYKIRKATMEKVPFILVVGEKEVETATVTVRERGKEEQTAMDVPAFSSHILEQIRQKL